MTGSCEMMSNLEEQIGRKIRDLRNQNGLTQEELADRTELTKGFISQLERGMTAPSVSTLEDIVTCLGSNLSDFFKEESQPQVVYKEEDYFEKVDDDGNITSWLVASAQGAGLEPIRVALNAGSSLPLDKPHDGEEFGYVLEGAVLVHLAGESYMVNEGESFFYKSDRDHWISNALGQTSVFIWVSSPPSF